MRRVQLEQVRLKVQVNKSLGERKERLEDLSKEILGRPDWYRVGCVEADCCCG